MQRLKLMGYWCGDLDPDWPDAAAFVDESWDQEERQRVAGYLLAGQRLPHASAGRSRCRLCGQKNGSLEYTDGEYVWPEGLAHYVADHAVRLPSEFVRKVDAWVTPEYWEGRVDHEWWRSQRPEG